MEHVGSLLHSQAPAIIRILSQINPINASPSHVLKINFNEAWVFDVVSLPPVSLSKPRMILSSPQNLQLSFFLN
jgi:hypothetical protein